MKPLPLLGELLHLRQPRMKASGSLSDIAGSVQHYLDKKRARRSLHVELLEARCGTATCAACGYSPAGFSLGCTCSQLTRPLSLTQYVAWLPLALAAHYLGYPDLAFLLGEATDRVLLPGNGLSRLCLPVSHRNVVRVGLPGRAIPASKPC